MAILPAAMADFPLSTWQTGQIGQTGQAPQVLARPAAAALAPPAFATPAEQYPSTTPGPSRAVSPPPAARTVAPSALSLRPAAAPAPAGPETPAATASAVGTTRLVLVARDGGQGPSYPVGETTDIGRLEGNILVADDRYVSPRHARIAFRAGAFFLRDLGSTNGVFLRIPFINGPSDLLGVDANSEQALGDQELFLLGQQVLRFEVVKHAEEGFGVASENGTLLFGTPAAPRYARLSQRTVEGVVRDVFHLRKAETVIGRESGDIVFPDDPFLSRRHAVLRVQGVNGRSPFRFSLCDLGSSNGSFLQIRAEVRLRHGDHFRIGQQLFRFDADAGRPGQ